MGIQKECETFQPKIGEKYWYISAENECGYTWAFWTGNPVHHFVSQFGVYRTKAEIKPIVALIRKITRNQEGFVLVPVKEIKEWFLDESENIYREDPDWLCDTPVGEVVEVEHRVSYELEQDPVFAAIQWDEINNDVGYYETFKSREEAEKVAAHCKAMIEAAEDKSL